MANLDIKPIRSRPYETHPLTPRVLKRIEVREESLRRLVRAVFSEPDSGTENEGGREIARSIVWEPNSGSYRFSGEGKWTRTDAETSASIIRSWRSMLRPEDAALIEDHLGLTGRCRSDITELLDIK